MNNNNRNAHAPHDDSAHKLLSESRERYLWQSVLGLARPPDLCDLGALARSLSADVAYQQALADTQGDGFGTGMVRMSAEGFERIPPSERRKP